MIKKILLIALFSFSSFSADYLLDSTNKCFGFDKVSVDTQDNHCVGMILSGDEGLIKPRKVIQINPNHFVITDMVNWNAGNGIVWEVKIQNSKTTLSKIFTELDRPHGIKIGPDGLIYIGEASQVFRFDLKDPKNSKEIVIENIPSEGKHALSEFIFTQDKRLILNVGAPTDQCLKNDRKAVYPCVEAEEEAVLREYIMNEDNSFSLVKNLAYGLRNSMGIVELHSGEIIQFNNGMDFSKEDSPLEEINLITDGANYGWPYCYGKGKLNRAYKRTFFNRSLPKIKCSDFQDPIGFLPAHSAPLDALLYDGEMFSEFKGKVLVSLHGYRKTGQRIVALEVNAKEKITSDFEEVVFGWQAKEGIRPKGAPVGLDIGTSGEVYFIDDKNKTLMVLAKGSSISTDNNSVDPVDGIINLRLAQFKEVQRKVFSSHCIQCHSEMSGTPEKVANYLIDNGLVKISSAKDSELYKRIMGTGESMMMPPTGIKLGQDEIDLVKNWINSISIVK